MSYRCLAVCAVALSFCLCCSLNLAPQMTVWLAVCLVTALLEGEGDVAAMMVEGIDRFLLKQTLMSIDERQRLWKPDYASTEAYSTSLAAKRLRLAQMLGVRDARVEFNSFSLVATVNRSALVGECSHCKIYAVRWPVVRDVTSEGLLLVPNDLPFKGTVVFLTDADQTLNKPAVRNGHRVLIAPFNTLPRAIA